MLDLEPASELLYNTKSSAFVGCDCSLLKPTCRVAGTKRNNVQPLPVPRMSSLFLDPRRMGSQYTQRANHKR
jgi:hypothetical protein